jgi:hypothetical protein
VFMLLSDQHKFFKNLITILLSIVERIKTNLASLSYIINEMYSVFNNIKILGVAPCCRL